MVGDDERDVTAGKDVGCKTAFIGREYKGLEEFVMRKLAP
jgi:phosphoglycolate phosphatase-like HAD superfamily hydrolase